ASRGHRRECVRGCDFTLTFACRRGVRAGSPLLAVAGARSAAADASERRVMRFKSFHARAWIIVGAVAANRRRYPVSYINPGDARSWPGYCSSRKAASKSVV
ncbi:MAG: hypothetical protein WB682_05155, partial [Candidatus Dormiibacterota bacterium]